MLFRYQLRKLFMKMHISFFLLFKYISFHLQNFYFKCILIIFFVTFSFPFSVSIFLSFLSFFRTQPFSHAYKLSQHKYTNTTSHRHFYFLLSYQKRGKKRRIISYKVFFFSIGFSVFSIYLSLFISISFSFFYPSLCFFFY